jgi:hypothetical protein
MIYALNVLLTLLGTAHPQHKVTHSLFQHALKVQMRLNTQLSGSKTTKRPLAILKGLLKENVYVKHTVVLYCTRKEQGSSTQHLLEVCSINYYYGNTFRPLFVIYMSPITMKSKKHVFVQRVK